MWDTPTGGRGAPGPAAQVDDQPPPSQQATHVKLEPRKNGKTPCPAFQRGQCKDPCPQNKEHVCAAAAKSGQICGMRNHEANACRNPRKAVALKSGR